MQLTLVRKDYSTYFSKNFAKHEKDALLGLSDQLLWSESLEKAISPVVLLSNSVTHYDSITPTQKEKIALVIHPNSGYDNIPLDWAQTQTPPIVIGHGIRAHAVTEYCLKCLFHSLSSPFSSTWSADRQWPRTRLTDQKALIVGMGHIGTLLRERLSPLMGEVFCLDPFKQGLTTPPEKKYDFIFICASLNESSHNLVDQSFLMKWCNSSSVLINGARGKLVNVDHLSEFARKNSNFQAFLDVFPQEPCDFSQFKDLKNFHLSSHVAGVYQEIENNLIQFERNCLEKFLTLPKDKFVQHYASQLLQNKVAQFEGREILI